jgi:HPt (histidine-containing phosphotransfer) domain-containing protein
VADKSAIDGAVIERLDRLGGKKLVLGMIDIFLEHAPTRVEAARAGLNGADFDEIRRAAHSLKSSAGNLGATQLQALCEEIERSGENSQNAEMVELVAQMGSETDAARQELGEIRKLYA